MKKFLSLLLALTLIFAFSGCSVFDCDEPTDSSTPYESSQTSSNPSECPFILSEGYHYVELPSERSFSGAIDLKQYIIAFCYDGYLRIFSSETGALVHSADYSSYGNLIRIEPYSEKTGFDYRLCFGDRVIYLSCDDFTAEEEVLLPGGVSFNVIYALAEKGRYDLSSTAFVYPTDSGIVLNIFGLYEKTIVENTIFPSVDDFVAKTDFWDNADPGSVYGLPGPVYLDDPRFICGGTKIVIGVFSKQDAEYIGCAVYNIEENTFENYIFCGMPLKPIYPIEDRYVYIPHDHRLIDVYDNTSSYIFYDDFDYESYDYKTFVTYNYEMDYDIGSLKNFESFVFDSETGGKKKFFSLPSDLSLYVEVITKNYFIIEIPFDHEEKFYAIKYTD